MPPGVAGCTPAARPGGTCARSRTSIAAAVALAPASGGRDARGSGDMASGRGGLGACAARDSRSCASPSGLDPHARDGATRPPATPGLCAPSPVSHPARPHDTHPPLIHRSRGHTTPVRLCEWAGRSPQWTYKPRFTEIVNAMDAAARSPGPSRGRSPRHGRRFSAGAGRFSASVPRARARRGGLLSAPGGNRTRGLRLERPLLFGSPKRTVDH